MTCPQSKAVADYECGELSANDAANLDQHIASCVICARTRTELRQALADMKMPAPGSAPSDVFIDRVVEAAAAANDAAAPARPKRTRPLIIGLSLAAAGILLAVGPSLRLDSRADRPSATFQARGGRPSHPLNAAIRLLRGGRFQAVPSRLTPSDAFGVTVTNQTDAPVHLLAFAIDARGEVHWFYPDYRDGAAPPRAVPIPPGTREQTLEQVVQPEGVAPGALRLVTVLLSQPVAVDAVEQRLRGRTAEAPVAPLFAGATVQEWMSTWENAR